MKQKLVRLDKLLTDKGLASSRTAAQGYIAEGRVKVNGSCAIKAATLVSPEASLKVDAPEKEWVSRGAYKLLRAFESFGLNADGRRCVDIGASTGGFTEVLLSKGAAVVYSVDVGYGQLAWKLRQNPRVVVMERTNARTLTVEAIDGEKADIIVSDASFISITILLKPLEALLAEKGQLAVLVKPQFEAGRERVGKGVITDPELHLTILNEVADYIYKETALKIDAADYSPIRGPEGNIEFLFLLSHRAEGEQEERPDFASIVKEAHEKTEAHPLMTAKEKAAERSGEKTGE